MNYERVYNMLIYDHRNALNGKNGSYCEEHHILPRSLGGTDDPENIVKLTARQHFIAHWLLHMMHRNGPNAKKMTGAFMFMCYLGKSRMSSIVYEHVKLEFSKAQRGKKMSDESRRKMSVSAKRNANDVELVKRRTELQKQSFQRHWDNDEEFRKYMQESTRSTHLGRKRSPETCAKLSVALQGHAPMTGKKHSVKTRIKQSESALERGKKPISDETRKRLSVAHKGQVAWNKGKSKEEKKAISDAKKARNEARDKLLKKS